MVPCEFPPGSRRIVVPEPYATTHAFVLGDARELSFIGDGAVHLIVTSPPYGSLKEYPARDGQLGNMESYEAFLDELDKVWAECARALVPGGRACMVVGDVCLSRRKAGRHHVLPLASDIQVRARKVGLDVLTPITWLKVANITLEASRSSRFLGKPINSDGLPACGPRRRSNSRPQTPSWACPGESSSFRGVRSLATRAWSLVVQPPRERPIAWRPLFCGRRCHRRAA